MSAENASDALKLAGRLISNLCDECITLEEAEQLELLVCANREVRQLYVRMMYLHCGLHEYASVLGLSGSAATSNASGSSNMNESMVIAALRDPIEEAGTEFEEKSHIPPKVYPRYENKTESRTTRDIRLPIIIAAIFVGILTLSVYYTAVKLRSARLIAARSTANEQLAGRVGVAQDISDPLAVASLTGFAGAVWDDAHTSTPDQKLHINDELSLQKGCVEITFTRGGKAVLEGPAKLTIDSRSEVFLHRGKLAATIPGGGFVVVSPSGVLKDLGTQFGVGVEQDGKTQVEVFEGRVAAELTDLGSAIARSVPLTLSAGQAAVISHATISPDPEGAVPQRFVTRLSSDVTELDLVDLVSGGDGTTHRRAGAIDGLTGQSGILSPVNARNGDWKVHSVPALPVIDSAFVPDGSRGPMAIDSAGHNFLFPVTSNISINHISAGGTIPWFSAQGISTVLGGVNYSAEGHGLLCIHSNNGMTVDLQAIRRLYPDRFVSRFHCKIGNSYVNGTPNETAVDPQADVFVIIDGNSRFEKRQFTHQDGVFAVDVSINSADRFLTFATTDGGDGINDDWVLWVDPVLNLTPRS